MSPLCVINRYDIHEDNAKSIEEMHGSRFTLSENPHDTEVPKSMTKAIPITRTRSAAGESIREIWESITL